MDIYKKRITDPKIIKGKGRRFGEDIKKAVVRDLLSGALTREEAMLKYNVASHASIAKWIDQYGEAIEAHLYPKPLTAEEKEEVEQLKKQGQELEKALELARMKIIALETMIDVAEEQLKIDIRKNSGTKPYSV